MGTKINRAVGVGQGVVEVFPIPIIAQRAPATTDTDYPLGQQWLDESQSPSVMYFHIGSGSWELNNVPISTDGTFASPSDTEVPSTLATKTYVDAVASFGAPIAGTSGGGSQGIGYVSTDNEAINRQINTAGVESFFLTPSNLDAIFASIGAPIGSVVADAGTFTDLTADGTGAVSLASNAAGNFTCSSGDLTLAASTNSVIINAAEAVADAIDLNAASGGLDVDVALLASITSTRNNAQAILLESTAGGIDILASGSGGSGEDIDIICTGGSVNISGTENVADAVTIAAANGGIDITCGGAAGEDIDLANTAGSIHLNAGEAVSDAINIDSSGGVDVDASGQVNIASSQNAADAVSINASAGGIEIIAVGAAAEDLVLQNTNGSVNVVAGEADAAAVSIQAAAGGLDADFALSCDINSSQAAATAINLNASAGTGGVTIAAGTGGLLFGNQADCTTIDLGDFAPTASRTITIGGGTVVTASVTDLIDIGPDGATTNADSVKQVDINTGTVATGQSLTNIATGAITSGTHTVSIQTGNAAAGTVACNISTGTGTKTVGIGNADGLTTTTILGPTDINPSQNNDVNICSGTSTGAITIGNTAAGAIVINSSTTITIGDASAGAVAIDSAAGISIDAATASNFACAAGDMTIDATTGSLNLLAGEAIADGVVIQSDNGGIDILAPGAGAGLDIDIVNTGGSVNVSATEADAAAIVVNASAGGLQLLAGGGAGLDTLITNTSGSITITAGESASDAFNLTASGAASAMNFSAGTGGFTYDSGVSLNVTDITGAGGANPVNGDDHVLNVDTSGGTASLTFPASPSTGRELIIYDTGSANTNNITLNGNGNNVVMSGAVAGTATIAADYASARCIYDGTVWRCSYTA